MERICRQGTGLFPKPAEIKFSCSCPDYASMCKHVAASLLGVGVRLDAKPELLFRLRGVDENDLVGDFASLPMTKKGPAAGKVLEADDMAALFGLDMGEDPAPVAAPVAAMKTAPPRKKAAAPKPNVREPAPAKKSPGAKKIAAPAMAARTKPPAARKMARSGSARASVR